MTGLLQPGSPEARAVFEIMSGSPCVAIEPQPDPLRAAVGTVCYLIGRRPWLDVVFAATDRWSSGRLADDLDRHLLGSGITVHRGARSHPDDIQVRYRFNHDYMAGALLVLVGGYAPEPYDPELPPAFQALLVHRPTRPAPSRSWLDSLAGPRDDWGEIPIEVALAGGPA